MAVLTGQAAIEYMNKNPNYRVLNSTGGVGTASALAAMRPPTAPKSWAEEKLGIGGFGGDLISTLTSPIRQGIIDPALQIGHTILNPNQAIGSQNSWFTTKNERDDYWDNPLLGGVKSAANIGAYAVPAGGALGGGLTGALKSAGASGALAGFGTSEAGRELEGTLGGALTGAATGGALYGLGKAASAVNKGVGNASKSTKELDKLISQYDGDLAKVPLERIDSLPKTQRALAYDSLGLGVENLTPAQQMADVTEELNPLQRLGRERQYAADGIKARAGDLDFQGMARRDKDALNWALKETNLGKATRNNLSELPSRLGEIRRGEVAKMNLTLNSNDIVDSAARKLMKTSNIQSLDDARNIVSSQLEDTLSRQDVISNMGIVPGSEAHLRLLSGGSGNIPVNQDLAFELTQKLGKDTANVLRADRLGRPYTPAQDAARHIDQYISNALAKESPKIAQTNRAFQALYRQNAGLVQSANRGANVSLTGGLASIPTQLWTRAEYWAGLGLEEMGNLLSKQGAPKGLVESLKKLPLEQAAQRAAQLAPVLAVQSQQNNISETPDMNSMIPTGGPSVGIMGGTPQQSVDPRAQQLGMAVLSGQIDPSRAKLAAELLGIGGGGSGAKLPSTAVQKMADTQATMQQLDSLQNDIQNSGQFGAITGGSVNDILSGIPLIGGMFADPTRANLRTQTDMLALQMAKAMTGGVLSDRDIAMFKGMMPQLNDSPAVAQAKLDALRARLATQAQTTQSSFGNAGYANIYDPGMIQQ